jgi:hypothetical protein
MARPFLVFAVLVGFLFPIMAGDPSKVDSISAVADLWGTIVLSAFWVAGLECIIALLEKRDRRKEATLKEDQQFVDDGYSGSRLGRVIITKLEPVSHPLTGCDRDWVAPGPPAPKKK